MDVLRAGIEPVRQRRRDLNRRAGTADRSGCASKRRSGADCQPKVQRPGSTMIIAATGCNVPLRDRILTGAADRARSRSARSSRRDRHRRRSAAALTDRLRASVRARLYRLSGRPVWLPASSRAERHFRCRRRRTSRCRRQEAVDHAQHAAMPDARDDGAHRRRSRRARSQPRPLTSPQKGGR